MVHLCPGIEQDPAGFGHDSVIISIDIVVLWLRIPTTGVKGHMVNVLYMSCCWL